MDTKEMIVVRYGELSLKGKNQKDFINLLARNMKVALSEFTSLTYEVKKDHIYISLNDESFDKVQERLKDVSGIASFSKIQLINNDIEEIKKVCLDIAKMSNASTFKIRAKRAYKLFPMHSDEINREVASVILQNTDKKVDVHNPELMININIRDKFTFVYFESIKGAGGYPLGIAGKSLMMLSGGIDSPVAAYLMMKRGVKLEMIHFAAPPYTQEGVIIKLHDLIHKLNRYQPEIKLHIIPFTKMQEEIYKVAGDVYAITLMRRMMYRIANIIASRNKCLCISCGESIGQVASQTLDSMKAIDEVSKLPTIRPLAIFDKTDIIDIANKIDTFEISIRPYEDCCTIFDPKNPTTKPNIEKIEKFESRFDFWSLIEEAANNEKIEKISLDEEF